jgi:mRNA interferase RelE/StbE
MAYAVAYSQGAAKELERMPAATGVAIRKKIEALSENPRPPGYKKLKGCDDLYRIRSGDYRVLYQIHDRQLLVLVVRVGNRRDVYRRR